MFVTNAVKHFKHTVRGKRRIHERPNAGEIEACRWWFGLELDIIKPSVVVAMGATAMRAITGSSVRIADVRGQPFKIDTGTTGIATVHPAYLLRLPDKEKARLERDQFVADLRSAGSVIQPSTRSRSAGAP